MNNSIIYGLVVCRHFLLPKETVNSFVNYRQTAYRFACLKIRYWKGDLLSNVKLHNSIVGTRDPVRILLYTVIKSGIFASLCGFTLERCSFQMKALFCFNSPPSYISVYEGIGDKPRRQKCLLTDRWLHHSVRINGPF